jgi:transcriptional regulator of acetoin/glycerol metabolism
MKTNATKPETADPVTAAAQGPMPGICVVHTHPLDADGAAIATRTVLLGRGDQIVLGRGNEATLALDDERLSRRHLRVTRTHDGRFLVEDLGSKNGTFLDGARLKGTCRPASRVARFGRHLGLFFEDSTPVLLGGVAVDGGVVIGPHLRKVLDAVASFAGSSTALHITGETGTGKEVLARAFHDAGPRPQAPFVAVSCATIPAALAERLLFGAKRGAYSGADADAPGYLQAADGGTLFLDEVAELGPELQAKLLRVIETGEIVPLGGTRGERAVLRFCSASHADLRAEAAAGRFRHDLYYRLGRPSVTAPPLRDRAEEIPFLVALALQRLGAELRAHPDLVEACLLRPWPGNVRELMVEVRSAGQRAQAARQRVVHAAHLSHDAGTPVTVPPETSLPAWPADDAIIAALHAEGGNVSATARRLGIHRTQLRRWLERRPS